MINDIFHISTILKIINSIIFIIFITPFPIKIKLDSTSPLLLVCSALTLLLDNALIYWSCLPRNSDAPFETSHSFPSLNKTLPYLPVLFAYFTFYWENRISANTYFYGEVTPTYISFFLLLHPIFSTTDWTSLNWNLFGNGILKKASDLRPEE